MTPEERTVAISAIRLMQGVVYQESDAWEGLRRNKSIAVSVILVTMISMYLLGVGLLAQQQVSQMKGYWYDRVQVSIYMCTETSAQPNCATGGATKDQKESVAAQLEEMELVDEVERIRKTTAIVMVPTLEGELHKGAQLPLRVSLAPRDE